MTVKSVSIAKGTLQGIFLNRLLRIVQARLKQSANKYVSAASTDLTTRSDLRLAYDNMFPRSEELSSVMM